MVGAPPLTAATGMDALTHAIEAYVAALANLVTDACAICRQVGKRISSWGCC
jgi:alcohol dehydrogenase